MGEKQNGPFQLSFNASLKVDFQGSRVTSDGGLILVRELDERLGFGDLIAQHLTDSRKGKNTQLPLADLFRQSVYSRIAGYEDVNDAERLWQDPTFRLIGSEKIWDSRAVVRFYNKRGTAEQWIKEGKQAVKMTRLSCHRFRSNEVRLWLSLIAYNLGNLWRRLVLPRKIENWSLTSLQQRLVKTGGRLVKHARYYWLMLPESHLTRCLFAGMVRRIAARDDDTAKSGRPGMGTGEVSMKLTEKKQRPDFWFFGWGKIGAWPSKKDPARNKSSQKLQFGDQKLAVCDRLNPIQEPKRKSRFYVR